MVYDKWHRKQSAEVVFKEILSLDKGEFIDVIDNTTGEERTFKRVM